MTTLVEGLRIAINSILLNRSRAALTTLGIIIGVGAVISLISLGRGVEDYVEQLFTAELGSNLLIVASQQPENEDITRIEPLTTTDVEVMLGFASIADIAPQYNILGFVSDEGQSMRTGLRGVTPNFPETRNWELRNGTFITNEHVQQTARVAVVGVDVVDALYDDENYDPIGQVVRLNNQVFTIIGVMEERNDPFNNDDSAVLVPLSTAQTRLADARVRGGYEVSMLLVRAASEDVAREAEEQIIAYLYAEHEIEAEEDEDFRIDNSADLLEIAGSITGLLTVFLGMIAGISLLVGGIGIMNIMLVTVTERTKEIGLRKALGAQPRDILLQFLFESVLLSLLGGFVGILVGWMVAVTGTQLIDQLTLRVDPDAVLLATLVSTIVGVGFGLFPANRAARMSPIDALRFE